MPESAHLSGAGFAAADRAAAALRAEAGRLSVAGQFGDGGHVARALRGGGCAAENLRAPPRREPARHAFPAVGGRHAGRAFWPCGGGSAGGGARGFAEGGRAHPAHEIRAAGRGHFRGDGHPAIPRRHRRVSRARARRGQPAPFENAARGAARERARGDSAGRRGRAHGARGGTAGAGRGRLPRGGRGGGADPVHGHGGERVSGFI